jgi:hypothetical protein
MKMEISRNYFSLEVITVASADKLLSLSLRVAFNFDGNAHSGVNTDKVYKQQPL